MEEQVKYKAKKAKKKYKKMDELPGDTVKLSKDFWNIGLFEVEIMQALLEIGLDKKLGKKYDKGNKQCRK